MGWQAIKGKISQLGQSTSNTPTIMPANMPVNVSGIFIRGTPTVYSYIEMNDGRLIKNISAMGGIASKLNVAFDKGEPVELYLWMAGSGDLAITSNGIIAALKLESGKVFAQEIPKHNFTVLLVLLYLALGLVLMPFVGIGLVLWWQAFVLAKQIISTNEIRKQIQALPDPIYI